jgi:hypothetical protein
MATDSKAPGSESFSEQGWNHSFSHAQFKNRPYAPLRASLSPPSNYQANLEAISVLDSSETPSEYLARSDEDYSELFIAAKIFVNDHQKRPSDYALPV